MEELLLEIAVAMEESELTGLTRRNSTHFISGKAMLYSRAQMLSKATHVLLCSSLGMTASPSGLKTQANTKSFLEMWIHHVEVKREKEYSHHSPVWEPAISYATRVSSLLIGGWFSWRLSQSPPHLNRLVLGGCFATALSVLFMVHRARATRRALHLLLWELEVALIEEDDGPALYSTLIEWREESESEEENVTRNETTPTVGARAVLGGRVVALAHRVLEIVESWRLLEDDSARLQLQKLLPRLGWSASARIKLAQSLRGGELF